MGKNTDRRDHRMAFAGRILFLTEDTALIRQQLEAEGNERERLEAELATRLANDDLPLMSNISTDEITPGWVCFYYDETLRLWFLARDRALRREVGRHPTRNRQKHRKDLRAKLAEHRAAYLN
jgi:hypothetical protein